MKKKTKGWLSHPLWPPWGGQPPSFWPKSHTLGRFGVAEPPTPLDQKKKKKIKIGFGPWTPRAQTLQSFLFFNYFLFLFLWGGQTTSIGYMSGSATLYRPIWGGSRAKPSKFCFSRFVLEVAKPLPWPVAKSSKFYFFHFALGMAGHEVVRLP